MHYYQHHIGDFIRDTANLNDHQLATYLRMLWVYYDTEKPIAGDLDDLAFAMRSDAATVRLLLRHYFQESAEGWRHTRCDKEISDYHSKAEKARQSANARWSNAKGMRTHSDRIASEQKIDANQEPITKNHKKHSPAPGGLEGRFEKFWLAYPRKVGKDAARKAFAKRKPDDELLSRMLSTIEAQVRSPEWQKEGGQFIPHPSTWLNQGRWEDVVVYVPADAVRTTVPARQGPDPNLQRIIEDQMKAVPPPADVREKLAQLRGRTDRPSH